MTSSTFAPAKQLNSVRAGRFYQTPDGLVLPSVTNVLNCIGKPALVNWAAKTEREMVIEAAANLWEDVPAGVKKMSRPAYVATLQERIGKTKAHQKELAKASEIGSQAHALIEWNLRKELGQKIGPEPRIVDKALWSFMAYEDWRKTSGLKPRAIEQVVWSATHGYAGTMDVFGDVLIEGHGTCLAVLDWKTGKAIYEEALLQNAAYVQALIEMGHAKPPVYGVIVRLPKVETDPDFEVKVITADEHAALFQTFLSVKALWAWLQERDAERMEAKGIDAGVHPTVQEAAERRKVLVKITGMETARKLDDEARDALRRQHAGTVDLEHATLDVLIRYRDALLRPAAPTTNGAIIATAGV